MFTANAAWLVLAVMAFNLTRAAGVITVAARIARSACRLVMHLPKRWRWEPQWTRLFEHTHSPPAVVPA